MQQPPRRARHWAALAIITALGLATAAMPALGGTSSDPKTAAEHAAKWIASRINADGGYTGSGTGFVQGTIDAALALAAANAERAAFDRAVDFVERNYKAWVPDKTGVERPGALGMVAVLARVAGKNPRSFGGSDLVLRIKTGATPAGPGQIMYARADFASTVYLHSWAVLGLVAALEPVPPEAIAWLRAQQCPNGGWMGYRGTDQQANNTCGATWLDPTTLAVQALVAAGQQAVYDPKPWFLAAQRPDGGFALQPGGEALSVNATALAAQAIAALGELPDRGRWKQADGDSPVSALLNMQVPCGSADEGALLYNGSANAPATSQGTWGLVGAPLPHFSAPSSYQPAACGSARPGTTPTSTSSPTPTPTPTPTSTPSTTPSPTNSPTPAITATPTFTAPTEDSSTSTPAGNTRTVTRVSGEDRFDSSVAVSREAFAPGVPVAFLANGGNFADALAAGAAATRLRGPLLLSTRDRLPPHVAGELERLRPSRIVALGGPSAVSEMVLQQASRYAPVERVSGPDRYETAGMLSRHAFGEPVRRLLVATGEDFPDALAAIGAGPDGPLLLVRRDEVPAATESELRRLAPLEVLVLGGTHAVSDGVLAKVREITGATVTRVSGGDRYTTAVAATRAGVSHATVLYVAAGGGFADALAGAAAAGVRGTGVLLVGHDFVPPAVAEEVRRLDPGRIVVLGGTASVSERVARELSTI